MIDCEKQDGYMNGVIVPSVQMSRPFAGRHIGFRAIRTTNQLARNGPKRLRS